MSDQHNDGVGEPSMWDRLDALPSVDDDPFDASWLDHDQPKATGGAPTSPARNDQVGPPEQFRVPAPTQAAPIVARPQPLADPIPSQPATPDVAPAQRTAPPPHHYPQPHQVPQAPRTRQPRPAPEPNTPRRHLRRTRPRRRRFRTLRRFVLLVLFLGLIGSLIGGWYLRRTWNNIERIELAQQLSAASPGFTNYLIVGTDSRAGLNDSLDSSDNIGLGVTGERSDTMVLLQRSAAGTTMMAVPRDLYVDVANVGPERINAAVAFGGPEALVATVQTSLGVPVHHYLEVDLAGFLNVVDALGGVAIDFPCPVTDPKSGLDIATSGEQTLNAEQALAYVRARTYIETCPGQPAQADGRADLGRVERQQYFLNAVFSKVVSTRNPLTLVQVAGDVGEGLRIDDTLKLSETLRLGRSINSNPPETIVLPTTPFTTNGGAQVLDLGPGAEDVLESFRT